MFERMSRPKSVSRRLALAGVAILVTLVALGLAWRARTVTPDIPPLFREELAAFEYDPWLIGYLFQGIVIPALLIRLLGAKCPFRWVGAARRHPATASSSSMSGGWRPTALPGCARATCSTWTTWPRWNPGFRAPMSSAWPTRRGPRFPCRGATRLT
jgi:hypothetical protein